jgi:hypothetical protein
MLIKKEENSCFFFPKFDIGWAEMTDNHINFLFSGQFHIGFVRIKQVGYKKNSFFDYLSTKQKKVLIKPTIKLERKIK